MTTIVERQDEPDNIKLLAAQRHTYSQAKRWHNVYAGIAVGLELAAPVILLLRPDTKLALDSAGAIALVLSIALRQRAGTIIKRGATIQEQFDVNVFELPWNRTFVGNRISPEVIYAADKAFKGDRSKLTGWYADPGDLPHPLDVLICQRSGLVWDRHLRRSYATLFNVLTVGYCVAGIVLGIVSHQMLAEYLAALLLPSMPALLEGLTIVREHTKIAAEEERVSQDILDLWDRGLDNPTLTTTAECRRLQDCSFLKRSNAPLVPDLWYWLFRNHHEAEMQATMADLRAKAARRKNTQTIP